MFRFLVILVTSMCCTLMAWSQGEVCWLEQEHDFGTINETDGKVSCTMRLVNTGDAPLVITRVQPTCGCTASDYTREAIVPGDTAIVTLIYNPANRPGEFDKKVFVYTNVEPRRSVLSITGKVIAAPETIDSQYPVAAGNLRLEVANVPMGELTHGVARNAYINAYNSSADTLVATIEGNTAHVSLSVSPDTIAPGSAAAIVVHYDTRYAPLWGFNADTLMVMSEPLHSSATAVAGIARVEVMAQVLEDMSKLTPKEREKAPELKLSTDVIDLDRLKPGIVRVQHVGNIMRNVGRSDLLVRRLWCPDAAVSIESPMPLRIKKGQAADLTLRVNPDKTEGGVLNTRLTVITNDPDKPVQQVRLVGLVTNVNDNSNAK